MNDTDADEQPAAGPQTVWVSVAEAAEMARVDTSTVRQWYRSGRLPTQRSQGDRGSFLVPLDAVLALVRGDEEGDAIVADLIDLNASYWSAQTEAAREEATAARNELSHARSQLEQAAAALDQSRGQLTAAQEQLGFLRSQLAESSVDGRQLRARVKHAEGEQRRLQDESSSLRDELAAVRADLDRANDELGDARSRLAALEAELDKLRAISSATGSITDNAWLALPTNSYRSPVRPQGMAAATANEALAGLIAATTPDRDQVATDELVMPALADEVPAPTAPPTAADAEFGGPPVATGELDESSEPAPAPAPEPARRVKPVFGVHSDDLLPQPEKKGRRGRR